MARTSFRVLLTAIILGAAAIAFAPAALLDAPLAARTGDRLRLVDAGGFWWNGQGVVSTADGRARIPVAWRIEMGPLAQGLVVIRLAGVDAAAPSGIATTGRDGTHIRDLRLRVPAAVVGAVDPRLQSVALGGNVAVDVPSFAASGTRHTGSVNATWENARLVSAATVVDLGTVSLTASPTGNGVAGTVRNTGGDVAIDGTLTDRTGVLEAILTLKPAGAAPDAVRSVLPLLGVPDGSGGARVTWRSGR
jgi:hypothetical protein